ncbi:MAG TPA: hypothetical protein GX699_05060 [Firmicutes bacterium]|nr:hypothetical protein [Bacillota bacterium]
MSYEIRLTVLSPVAEGQKIAGPPAPEITLARRLGTLENKTVYLVDTGFGGSAQFMVRLQKWFSEHLPSVKTIRRRKSGNVFMEDESSQVLWNEIKEKGDAVILGVAG